MIKVGVIEDNFEYREEIIFQLQRSNFEIIFESDGSKYKEHLKKEKFDIIILDLELPDIDGMKIARFVEKNYPHIGIIILTARESLEDKLMGLNLGADTYLTKPIEIEELVATINAVYRRLKANHSDNPQKGWVLNYHQQYLITPSNQKISISPLESQLLVAFIKSAPHPVTKKDLVKELGFELHKGFESSRLEVILSRLRKKIENIYPSNEIIKSARQLGYVFGDQIKFHDE